jgi:hypothetical protein
VRSMKLPVVALAGLLSLSVVQLARAESKDSHPLALDADVQLGWVQGKHSGGADAGITARLRYAFLALGLSGQAAHALLGSMASASVVAGVSIPVGFIRFDGLGELGLNTYSSVGAELLGNDPGAGGTLPFAGGRAAVLARVFQSHGGTSLWVGPAVQYATDLRHATVTYTYRDQGQDWFSGDEYDNLVTNSVRLGQSRVSVLMTVNLRLPL